MSDAQIRVSLFDQLSKLSDRYGDILSWSALTSEIMYQGELIRLLGPKGIWKPASLELPISIATSPKTPYADSFSEDGLLQYHYRADQAGATDNNLLRRCMLQGVPLVYLHGVAKGKYVAAWPVYVVGDDPVRNIFSVAVDDKTLVASASHFPQAAEGADARRRYLTVATKTRLHQRTFRVRVLEAYKEQCAVCRLKHVSLLEAAHIIPDAHPDGEPIVSNGLSLCKIHHAAFDQNIMGISPDYQVKIRLDILEEIDGPMLKHGLQEMHDSKIVLPRSNSAMPNRDSLAERFEQFTQVSAR